MASTATENPRPGGRAVSGPVGVAACAAMAFLYVAILYSPTLILRLPPPTSLDSFMIRRFACAIVASAVSVLASALLLGLGNFDDLPSLLGAFGIRSDHLLQALVIPLFLTSLVYAGSLVSKASSVISSWEKGSADSCRGVSSYRRIRVSAQRCFVRACAYARNVMTWRNYVVAPLTEELVFRACMIPLLLCGGYKTYSIIFFSPVFFSLAHLNHFLELYYEQGCSFLKAFLIVGIQLCYTVVFGWYASFLFIRTGNLISPVAAHVLCNALGLPVLSSSRTKGAATIAFVAGLVAFGWLVFPATSPELFNDRSDACNCWHGYCSWN